MKKLLWKIPAGGVLAAASLMLAPQPAFAMPTCEQEVSIRCSGFSVQNRGRLDIYHNSYEECVEYETPLMCPRGIDPLALDGRAEDAAAIFNQARA